MSVTPAVLSTRINPFLATALRAHCKARGVSMSWAITRAIRDWLDRQPADEHVDAVRRGNSFKTE